MKRFQREARAAGQFDSQHICRVIDTGTDSETGRPYMAMDLLTGEELEQRVRRIGPLHPHAAAEVAAQTCIGLERAHQAGIVHRDIKPANVFLAEQDERVVAKILDFGIAKIAPNAAWAQDGASITRTGALMGSPLYMSPEQARGKSDIDARTDIYAVGSVLYFMLAGRAPFQHVESFGDLIISVCSDPLPPLTNFAPWVPSDLIAVVEKALETSADDRFATAKQMATALRDCLPEHYLLDPSALEAFQAPRVSAVGTASARAEEIPASLSGTTQKLPAAVQSAAAAKRKEDYLDVQTTVANGQVPPTRMSSAARERRNAIVVFVVGFAVLAFAAAYLSSRRQQPPAPTQPTAVSAAPTKPAESASAPPPASGLRPVASAPLVQAPSSSAASKTPPSMPAPASTLSPRGTAPTPARPRATARQESTAPRPRPAPSPRRPDADRFGGRK